MTEESTKKYQPVGERTLIMFMCQKGAILFLLIPLLILALIGLNYVPSNYVNLASNIIIGYVILLLIILGLAILTAELKYSRYGIYLDETSINGIPYNQIKDVKIERSVMDQLFGVSDVIIIVKDGNQITLPALSNEIALEIQNRLWIII